MLYPRNISTNEIYSAVKKFPINRLNFYKACHIPQKRNLPPNLCLFHQAGSTLSKNIAMMYMI